MKVFKKSYLPHIFEAAMVTFGVLLALFVNECNEQRKIDNNTEQTLEFIIAELHTNITKFENSVAYHTQLKKEIDSTSQHITETDLQAIYYSNTKFKHFQLPSWKGIGIVEPDNIVFESAKMNGVFQEINIPTTQLISEAYQKMKAYDYLSENALEAFLNINSETKTLDVFRILELMKYDILNFEEYLQNHLEQTKEELQRVLDEKRYKK
ncbi:hypothetical protein [Neptunitalea lumnitzerae]|uniref:Uncharacterized protein n=1 Tax=Neptunitalea lumnitzerae TaxID=2965509 RepID=A0ABQ5MFI5_9FLAO|nr:hypothetical protein [Neptunitalea sp. Y10]GLB47780.1 hypothetical protein Y10_01480 [Neptunitalea sp. Y10]